MAPSETPTQAGHIQAFLQTSRAYLGLARQLAAAPALPRPARRTAQLRLAHLATYRKAIQSCLVVLGTGALAAAPALADNGCDRLEEGSGRHARASEAQHDRLHAALALTAEQEAGWKKLRDFERGPQPPGMAEVAALQAFYATLNPAQRQTFERFAVAARAELTGTAKAGGQS